MWGSCKGSQEGTRGYTCGLWLALHSLAAHAAPEDSGGAFFMASLRCTQRHLSSMLRVLQRSAGFMSAARAAAVACGVIRLTALALQGLYQTLLPVLRVLGALSGAAERQGRCSRAKPRRCGAVVVACAQPGSIPSLRLLHAPRCTRCAPGLLSPERVQAQGPFTCANCLRPAAPQVNARLAEEEKERGDGDPFYPKLQWPTAEVCALCRAPVLRGAEAAEPQWNEGEVARFLVNFFSAPPGTVLQRPPAAQKAKRAWGSRCGPFACALLVSCVARPCLHLP